MKPFRFLAGATSIVDGRTLAETARAAEASGIDVLVIPDHLVEQLAPVPMLATAAAATERLRIGSFVFNNDLRHPAVLAQDLASLDVLSDGRLEVGIGAGWRKPEYDAIGIGFDPIGTRVTRLEEALEVLKGAFAEGPFSFGGKHYTITDLDGQPKPVQKPHPPFFIGGGGRRLLTLAGREADTVSLAPRLLPGLHGDPRSITLAATEEKVGWVRASAGSRFAAMELNVYPSMSETSITDHARRDLTDLATRLRERTGVEITPDELAESPNVFIGSLDALVEKLQMLRERLGISSFMLGEFGTLNPLVARLAGT